MPVEFLEHTATADLAFEITAPDLNQLFEDAALAIARATIHNLEGVRPTVTHQVELTADSMEALFYAFLEELVFLKDTKRLIFSRVEVRVQERQEHAHLTATLKGEELDQQRHELGNDIKAITYHQFKLEQREDHWYAHVIIDI